MNDTPTTLLVAERDERTREFLIDQLTADGFAAHGAQCAEEARVKLAHFDPQLLMLGELEQPHAALTLLRGIRSRGLEGLPVIVVGSEDSEIAQLRAFEAGCDDYLRKPLRYPLLLARVRALVRRASGRLVPRRRIGALEIDALQREVTVAERPLRLSRLEFELLSHLAIQPTRVYTKQELLREVWGFQCQGRTRTLDAHACRLRKKLAQAGAPHLIVNTRGVGYRLSAGPVMAEPEGAVAVDEREPAVAAAGNGRAA